MGISRLVEPLLKPFDDEKRNLVIRWRMWKMEWFPYQTADVTYSLSHDPWQLNAIEDQELVWQWNPPRKVKKMKRWLRSQMHLAACKVGLHQWENLHPTEEHAADCIYVCGWCGASTKGYPA